MAPGSASSLGSGFCITGAPGAWSERDAAVVNVRLDPLCAGSRDCSCGEKMCKGCLPGEAGESEAGGWNTEKRHSGRRVSSGDRRDQVRPGEV